MIKTIDINSDIGEGYGRWTLPGDRDIINLVTSANIACGWHAGDPTLMRKTVEACACSGTGIGAHPGFPDRLGFGRREMKVSPNEIRDYMIYQIGALSAFAKCDGVSLSHVKPHGALYNMGAKDPEIAKAIVSAVKACDSHLILVALSGSEMIKAAKADGLTVASEVFADRAYNDDGSLVSRSLPGAVITDAKQVAERAVIMANEGKVTTISGNVIDLEADTICVHGDTPEALEIVETIREAFQNNGIEAVNLQLKLREIK